MKVLHVWNTAGVASLMVKHLRLNGIDSDVIMRASHDPFGFTEYYDGSLLNCSSNEYIKNVLLHVEDYDIIHIHSALKMCRIIGEAFPGKKIVFQHHGTELTTKDFDFVRSHYKYVSDIITSTIDLHELLNGYGIDNTFIDNAVDTDFFYNKKQKRSGACCDARYNSIYRNDFIKGFHEGVSYIKDVDYFDMCLELNKFELFIDVKFNQNDINFFKYTPKPVQAYSKMGREALACGLEVFNYKGEIVKGLPIEFTPEYQVKELIKLYNQ